MSRLVVVGSANMDLVVRTPRFPQPGESILGSNFATFPGGKGANQAVAAGRLGSDVALVGKLGEDSFAKQLLDSLRLSGVQTRRVLRDSANSTGVAIITVDEQGQNTIVVASGANMALRAAEVHLALEEEQPKVVITQLEVPDEAVAAASRADALFILNPAPARSIAGEVLARTDYITPNETEAEILTGIRPSEEDSCLKAARVLLDQGVANVLFTLGEAGSYLANKNGGRHFPAQKVQPVDTTAAGDAFNGAFAHFLSAGEDPTEAIRKANVVGAYSVTKPGAQASMPTLADLLESKLL